MNPLEDRVIVIVGVVIATARVRRRARPSSATAAVALERGATHRAHAHAVVAIVGGRGVSLARDPWTRDDGRRWSCMCALYGALWSTLCVHHACV